MILNDTLEKIKGAFQHFDRRDIVVGLIIILSATGAFGLGRLSRLTENRQPITITAPDQSTLLASPVTTEINKKTDSVKVNSPASASPSGKSNYVASKSGAKYHFTWCPGAKTISEANKIWFQSAEEARAAGYAPASNCKGLK